MANISEVEVEKVINGLKYCPIWNSCKSTYCEKNEIFYANIKCMDYIVKTMQEHNLSVSDLERLLVTYKKNFKKHKEDETTLIGKISKIHNMCDLEHTSLEFIADDVCPLI